MGNLKAVLHLLYAVVHKNMVHKGKLKSIYIKSPEENEIFSEMEDFLNQTHTRYKLDVIMGNGDIKTALSMTPN